MTDARLWHLWLRINRVLRVMLHTRWSVEAWARWRPSSRRRSRCGVRFCQGDRFLMACPSGAVAGARRGVRL